MIDRETVKSFAYPEDDELIIVDRSTLERFEVCPAQARFLESGQVLNESLLAAAGEGVHQAFGAAVREYMLDPDEPVQAGHLADVVASELRSSRPDIQPEAIAAGRASIWAWADYISRIHPRNIVRYDGGEGDKSGQLSADILVGNYTLRLTSELDLLHSTRDQDFFREVDYKSGFKKHTALDVAASFQFGMHVWLIFENYLSVDSVEVQVWNTRSNSRSFPVTFYRARKLELETRIRYAAGEYVRWRNTAPENTDVWPSLEKCPLCPAAALCPASLHVGDVAADPEGFVGLMVALDAKLDAMRKLASAHVKAKGDLQTKAGCYGYEKPKTTKGQRMGLYTMTADDSEESEAEAA